MTAGDALCGLLVACLAVAAPLVSGGVSNSPAADDESWSPAELAILRSLQQDNLPDAPADPSNAVERLPQAAALGRKLFFDPRFSANQKISCATCHLPQQQFQDNRALGLGMATGLRRTMPIVASGYGPWQFWDGRKDSVWSQALGPMEDAREHGGNRTAYAKVMADYYRRDYEAIFQPMPDLAGLPAHAGPNGSAGDRQRWEQMTAGQRADVSRIYANMGKAIAAYEKTLRHGRSRLDDYIGATLRRDPAAQQTLSNAERRGLRLFIGKAQCVSCHAGPLLSDQHFHNTGVPAREGMAPDKGRAAAIELVLRDEFNCLGPYSDARRSDCQELDFIAKDDKRMLGAFKTPGLRNVAERAPYMHAGQIATLADVVRHYAKAPRAAVGQSERQPLALSETEIADLVNFLGTLSGPIQEAGR